jgi:hypothetical protein
MIASDRTDPMHESWSNYLNREQDSRIKWELLFPFDAILLLALDSRFRGNDK